MKRIVKAVCFLLAMCCVLPIFSSCRKSRTTDSSEGSFSSGGNSSGETQSSDVSDLKTEFVYRDLGFTDHAALSRKAAAEGMVLLENKNNSLPLKKENTVAVFGKGQIDFYKGGTGSGDVNALYTVNFLEGIQNKENEGKLSLYQSLARRYMSNSSFKVTDQIIRDAAAHADVAIMVISRNTGEMYDRKPSAGDYMLSAEEESTIAGIIDAGFKNVVVVLNIPSVMDVSFMEKYPGITALLVAWQPGMEGGNAVADVLCGDVNPSGKLADTFACSYWDYPTSETFNRRTGFEEYTEDIYIGYRYFETFDPKYQKVAYPFGFGLSYTDFEIENVRVACDGKYVQVKADVYNTGKVAGKEVVQVYYSAPNNILDSPARELAAYAKTDLIEPGAHEEVTVSFALSDMAGYDDLGKISKAAYVLEKGEYKIYVGNSVRDAGQKGVRYTYTQAEHRPVEQLSTKLQPKNLKSRMTSKGSENLQTGWDGIELSDLTLISSTDYTSSTVNVALSSGKGKSGTAAGISSFTMGGFLTYTLNCPQEGDYRFILFVGASGNNEVENAFVLKSGDAQASVNYTCSGGLYNPAATEVATLHLKKGQNTLSVKNSALSKSCIFSHMCVFAPGNDASGVCPSPVRKDYQAQPKSVKSFTEVYKNPELLGDFIRGLTLDELVGLFVGHGATVPGGTGTIGTSDALGIAGMNTADGPAGLRLSQGQTAWPIGTLLACTFDQNLIYNVGLAIGEEMVENNVDLWLAPGMNIHRDPLCGRNFEYYSEDPYLTGMSASAVVLGVQSKGVGVMVKHFALNNRETNRKDCDSICSERAIREIYLKGFEIVIKNAQPWAVMSSYNMINGVYASENRELLTDILRSEWGFEGFVSTDWENKAEKFRELQAGNEVSMPSGDTAAIKGAYAMGLITEEELYTAAERILKIVLKSPAMSKFADPPAEIIPDNGSALRIKAVNWAKKSDRISIETCEDVDGGNNPKFTEVNCFLAYYVEAQKAGKYTFTFRLASPNGAGAFDLYIDGQKVGNYKIAKNTGGWQTWDTFEDVLTAELSEGKHEIEIRFTAEQININWFEIEKVD